MKKSSIIANLVVSCIFLAISFVLLISSPCCGAMPFVISLVFTIINSVKLSDYNKQESYHLNQMMQGNYNPAPEMNQNYQSPKPEKGNALFIFITVLCCVSFSCCLFNNLALDKYTDKVEENSSQSEQKTEAKETRTTATKTTATIETTAEITTTAKTTTIETTTITTTETTVTEITTAKATEPPTETTIKVSSDEIITLLKSILDEQTFEYKIDYYEEANMYSVCIWQDGLGAEIALGIFDVSKLEEPLIAMSKSMSEVVRTLDPDVYAVMLNVVDDRDEDSLLTGAVDGKIYFPLDDLN